MEPIWWVLTWFLGGHRKSFFRIAFKFYRFELLLSHNIPLVFGFLLWQQISKYIDEHYKNFQNFLNFHLIMCRSVSVVVLVGQVILSVFRIRLFFFTSILMQPSYLFKLWTCCVGKINICILLFQFQFNQKTIPLEGQDLVYAELL